MGIVDQVAGYTALPDDMIEAHRVAGGLSEDPHDRGEKGPHYDQSPMSPVSALCHSVGGHDEPSRGSPSFRSRAMRRSSARQEKNWIQTVPGKGWFVLFRFEGPLEPFFDKTWKPADIERGR
jgi:hypothetical protein